MNSKFSHILITPVLVGLFSLFNTRSRIQELTNYSEIKNLRNKGHAKISESTVEVFNFSEEPLAIVIIKLRHIYDVFKV